MNLDFIENLTDKAADEFHIEGVCHELAIGQHLYDGSNPYGEITEIDYKGTKFRPTVEEIRRAMDEFKKRGWYGTYDREIGYYAVYKTEPALGEWQRKCTTFLFRPSHSA